MNAFPSLSERAAFFRVLLPSRGVRAAILLGLFAAGAPVALHAQVNSWTNATDGLWTDSNAWLLGAAPSNNPHVYLTNAGSKTVTIDAGTPAGNLTLTNLTISAASGATNTLLLAGNVNELKVINGGMILGANSLLRISNGAFSVRTLTLGNAAAARGEMILDGGSNTITHTGTSFILGSSAGSTGLVLITEGQLVTSAGTANIGQSGVGIMTVSNGLWRGNTLNVGLNAQSSGSFTIAGGSNFFNTVTIGSAANATGNVTLTGGQMVVTNTAETATLTVGSSGVGTLTVANGEMQAQTLYVGRYSGGSGNLTLAGGTSVVTKSGSAFFAGNNANSTGTVVLAGGLLDTRNGTAQVGYSGIGNLIGSGGTWLASAVYAGNQGGSWGALTISAGTNVLAFDNLYLGSAANSTGTVTITDGWLVTTNGTVRLGTLGVGAITASGGNWLAKDVYAGSTTGGAPSLFHVSGGTHSMSLLVGVDPGSTGTVLLTGGQLVTTNNANTYLGYQGAGSLTVSGGTWLAQTVVAGHTTGAVGRLEIASGSGTFSGLILGNTAGATGTVLLSGGNLAVTNASGNASLLIGAAGSGSLTVSNGIVTADRLVATNGIHSKLGLIGGTMNTRGAQVANGANFGVGDGTSAAALNLLGGTHAFADGLTIRTNASLFSLAADSAYGAGGLTVLAGGAFQVSNGNSTVSGVVSNSGTIRVVNSRVSYTSPVVIHGTYLSDPSTNTFASNVTVTAAGALQGGAGDLFVFQADLAMQSTNRAGFNLADAAVLFTNATAGGTNHTFSLAGSAALDLGSNWPSHASLATNFSIGRLGIASGNRLTLTGDHGTNALYVGWLDLSGWSTNAGALTNTLLSALALPDVNLYYDEFDPNNAYLGGLVYGFDEWGVGHGLLIPIPEPSAWLAVGLGGGLLLLLRRRHA